MEVTIKNSGRIKVELNKNNEFDNCHEFTKAVILELKKKKALNEGLDQFVSDLQTKEIHDVYLSAPGKVEFNKQDMETTINAPGLILFTTDLSSAPLQHSMIVIRENVWQGANNINSLGAEDKYVHKFKNMDQRNYPDPNARIMGGWDEQGFMCSLYGDKYTMYYVPLCAPWIEDNQDGCCAGCIIV